MTGEHGLVARRATNARGESRPLHEWRVVDAYVLLASPGAGKTTSFGSEAELEGLAEFVTANDLIALPSLRERLRGKTIYIDALDEMRTGGSSSRAAFNSVRKALDTLHGPRFRIACREADWLGATDIEDFRKVARRGEIEVLHLDPLSEQDARVIVAHEAARRKLAPFDVEGFLRQCREPGGAPFLENPMHLGLLVAVAVDAGGSLPRSTRALYSKAIPRLLGELSPWRVAQPVRSEESLLHDAGLLCAVLLLSGRGTFSRALASTTEVPLSALADEIRCHDPDELLRTPLFVSDGAGWMPLHRTIAEFLGARWIAERIRNGGLSVERFLALATGYDGVVVEPLRGLAAWVSVHSLTARVPLIERDSLGVVLYGDVSAFSVHEKARVLSALRREAEASAGLRDAAWRQHPFGALGTRDMAAHFSEVLRQPGRSDADEALLRCVIDAIRWGEPSPDLLACLEGVIRDGGHEPAQRTAALRAWIAQSRDDLSLGRKWLDEIRLGEIADPDDGLCGELLEKLYPSCIAVEEVFAFLHAPKIENLFGTYRRFWDERLLASTPSEKAPELADAFARHAVEFPIDIRDRERISLAFHVVATALENAVAPWQPERVRRWLRALMNPYGSPHQSSRQEASRVREWLEANPEIQKAVVLGEWTENSPDVQRNVHAWQAEMLLFGATRPTDWFDWLLEVASRSDNAKLAEYCFAQSARDALVSDRMRVVELWVEQNEEKWPHATTWRDRVWTSPLDDNWLREDVRARREKQAHRERERKERRATLERHRESIEAGTGEASLLVQIAVAHAGGYSDIDGNTPEERVADFLVSDVPAARRAIDGVVGVLRRTDLPSAEAIHRAATNSQEFRIGHACLLAARLVHEQGPTLMAKWSDALAGTLIAFHLNMVGNEDAPAWFVELATGRPDIAAPLMEQAFSWRVRRRPDSAITALWSLAASASWQNVARRVLPSVLDAFPVRAGSRQLALLIECLIPGALRHLGRGALTSIARERLERRGLDAGQRITWLAVASSIAGDGAEALLAFAGTNQRRARQLAAVLDQIGDHGRHALAQSPEALKGLIQTLGPLVRSPGSRHGSVMRARDAVSEVVNALIRQLATGTDAKTHDLLAQLRTQPALAQWSSALLVAEQAQRRAARLAAFRHPEVPDLIAALTKGVPANALDLAAVMRECLRDAEAHFRNEDTNAWTTFWRDDRSTPQHEPVCRDRLLDWLRPVLGPRGVRLEKEASAAGDKRSDVRASIRVDGEWTTVPIEVKKDRHPKLWTAWRDQLQAQYMIEPAADGVGIYLVLWFGHETRRTPEGVLPRSATELASMLRDRIPEDDRDCLSVVVMDLSAPHRGRAPAPAVVPSRSRVGARTTRT